MRITDEPPAPVCPKCGAITWLASRVKLPEVGRGQERQTYDCPKCNFRIARIMGPGGHTSPPLAPASDDEVQSLAERMTGLAPRRNVR